MIYSSGNKAANSMIVMMKRICAVMNYLLYIFQSIADNNAAAAISKNIRIP